MWRRSSIASMAIIAALVVSMAVAQTRDAAKYPDWSGQWRRPESGPNKYDPTKPPGLAQQAPLTPEYLEIFW